MKALDATTLVIDECSMAMSKHSPFASAHEGYAVLKEEVDELWDVIKRKPDSTRKDEMRAEAIQVAAMALRFLIDVC